MLIASLSIESVFSFFGVREVFGFWTIQVDFGAPARTAGWFF